MRLLTTSLLALSLLTGGSFVSSDAFAGKGKDCKCEECKDGKCEHKGKKGKKGECSCCGEGASCSAEGHSHEGHDHDHDGHDHGAKKQ